MLDEHREVVGPVAEGGQGDGEDLEPVIEVLAEAAVGDHLVEVAVGGGDEADVGPDRVVAAEALEPAVLQEAEHLGLGGRRHVADLVEEDGAAVGLLELADPAAVGAGEGALLVAEELALQEGLGDGGAVDGQEGGLAAEAVLIDGPGDQFLAGPALAGDQDGHVLAGGAADGLVDRLHGGRPAHDPVGGRVGGLLLVVEEGADVRQAALLEGAGQDAAELAEVERLEQILDTRRASWPRSPSRWRRTR